MRQLTKIFRLLILCVFTASAQDNTELVFKAEMIKNNGEDHLTLYSTVLSGNIIEGFFYLPQYEPVIDGEIRKGGFSFLVPEIFDVAYGAERLRKDWVKNNFPVTDLEGLTNGVNIEKIFSFYIIPEMKNLEDDSITLFFKYSVYNLLNKKRDIEWDLNFDIKLFYKKVKVPFTKDLSFDFADEHFDDYHFLFSIERMNEFSQVLNLQDAYKFFEEIQKSVEESAIQDNFNIKLSAEFIQLDADGKMWGDFYSGLKLRQKHSSLPKNKLLNDQRTLNNIRIKSPVYTAKLKFPFRIYNLNKEKEYKSYNTRSTIFNSFCNIVIVPVLFQSDSLTADVFIDYSKLNAGSIPRWTPIKKRIVIPKGSGIKIDLPKENWTANFKSNGERYDIYGYSDFEKFINEYLVLSFHSIKTNNEN